jgi:hypothetical protein
LCKSSEYCWGIANGNNPIGAMVVSKETEMNIKAQVIIILMLAESL